MELIKVENLSLGYDSNVIVTGLNFTVSEGDYLCIVGENGSGKSTLMKTMLHLQNPISGDIIESDEIKKGGIGYLPQQTVVQRDFPASVEEIVMSGYQGRAGFHPFYSKEEKEEARENMLKLGIEELAKKCYRELSGGQQQRVLLCRALCSASKILLLDEPVTGLDPMVTEEMYSLIKKLNIDGITIIMISHDISAALNYATHILHIGNDVFYGTKEEYEESVTGRRFLGYDAESEVNGDA